MNIFSGDKCNGILKAGTNILNFEIRIILLNNFIKRKPLIQKFEDALNRDTRTFYTGLAEVDFWVYSDSGYHFQPFCLTVTIR